MQKGWAPAHAAGAQGIRALRRSFFLALCLTAAVATAQTPEPTLARRDAAAWLGKIHRAAQRENYVGTLIYQRGSVMHASRIQHFSDLVHNEYERLETLDGKPREVLRQNDIVHSLIPEAKLVVVERQDAKDRFPALLATNKGDVLDLYEMRRLSPERVAGMECEVFSLVPHDGARYAVRLWAEKHSGLLMRAQTIGEGGKVLEQVAFSQIEIGVPSEKQKILGAIKNASNWQRYEINYQPANIAEEGWLIAVPVKGFQKIREVRRPLGDLRSPQGSGREQVFEVLQVVYSDGLTGLSVFIEPVSDQRVRREGVASLGATQVVVRKVADFWITVVGEVPAATVKQFAAAVEYRAPKPR
ncbi:MucB/RseB C-terminal domain-containing protein [Cupriavidus gilardii]|uniref:MucB/RseB C-terminal domain-containing protein n=1 Tax=Cupriavidus gilardii TaxID=82541 RepID=A0ABY4VYV9_9BURK|nr:MucB/RseB C-terminal domain-containing protein [Cupriavidus gilardii]QQE08334.1 MucB/RseB C-terminal domain-containing protein [Cupriavidus sp. ISTL7]MCT9073339.1 MucB/RseB C-terminal domain-containing protein [Cupriavidus gilardii]MCT9114764.1 MucB/RseB C-terminal domain-containing protein [Cupriavidus gilardii]MCT9123492.1 MucB/RseB C-terminal domain-containing protein [Cupriavidus gilardii]QKS64065.1 MucB/RseB C-terminal domain-containing protein [Cupriavidus gilardii]